MSFTPEQVNDIAIVIGTTPTLLNAHLTVFGASLTSDKATKVLAQVTRYENDTVEGEVSFKPNDANEGFAQTAPYISASRDPRSVIIGLLEIPVEICTVERVGYGSIRIGL